MGSDVTPGGLKFQFTDRIKPIAKRQLEALASGADPKDVNLNANAKGSSSGEILVLYFFSCCTITRQPPDVWHLCKILRARLDA